MEILKLSTNSLQSLNSLFPEPQQQSKTAKAKSILGEFSKQYNDEQLDSLVADFEFLADTWLDDFERASFDGKTLNELLKLT